MSLLAGLALGQGADTEKKPVTDAQFVQKASAVDLAEINLGRIAQLRAENAVVKQFAQKMVEDHTQSSKALLKLVNQRSWRVSSEMDAKHQALAKKLLNLSGAEFDREYMEQMVMGHKKAVQLYENGSKHAQDESLKALAKKGLPVISQHLKMAQDIVAKLSKKKGAENK